MTLLIDCLVKFLYLITQISVWKNCVVFFFWHKRFCDDCSWDSLRLTGNVSSELVDPFEKTDLSSVLIRKSSNRHLSALELKCTVGGLLHSLLEQQMSFPHCSKVLHLIPWTVALPTRQLWLCCLARHGTGHLEKKLRGFVCRWWREFQRVSHWSLAEDMSVCTQLTAVHTSLPRRMGNIHLHWALVHASDTVQPNPAWYPVRGAKSTSPSCSRTLKLPWLMPQLPLAEGLYTSLLLVGYRCSMCSLGVFCPKELQWEQEKRWYKGDVLESAEWTLGLQVPAHSPMMGISTSQWVLWYFTARWQNLLQIASPKQRAWAKAVPVSDLGSWNTLSMEEAVRAGYCAYPDESHSAFRLHPLRNFY